MSADKPTRVEWRKAPDFAEVAEALRIPTSLVFALRNPTSSSVLAFYTENATSTLIYSVTLLRGVDGTLYVASIPEPHPGMWKQITENIERSLDDRFGPGDP